MNTLDKDLLLSLKERFFERSSFYDEIPQFPHENYNEIVQLKLHTINLPQLYGGLDLGMEATCDYIIEIASVCPSTALCLAMHYYSLGGFKKILPPKLKDKVFRDVWENGQFIASISNPNILLIFNSDEIKKKIGLSCEKVDSGYVINGSKMFVSGCPRVKYLPLYCFQDEVQSFYKITAFLAEITTSGITVDETWNYAGMRASMSYNVHFNNVFLPEDFCISREGYGIEDTQNLIYWFRLLLVSVYQGISRAAYEYIFEYIKTKKDSISDKVLAQMPGIQYSIAEMKIMLETSYSQLKAYARQVEQEEAQDRFSDNLYIQSLITKEYVTKTANEVVWKAMQIQGTNSLMKGNLLERLYRDVRAATFHPPAEDLLKETIAKKSLGIIPIKKRWI